jgi:N-acetyl-anhydromuramoyl-L-alanine amidase
MVWRAEGWLDGAECLPSPNFGERPVGEAVSLIVVHNISLPPNQFGGNWVEKFFLNQLDPLAHPYFATIVDAQVSAHFYVRRDGRLIQFVGCDNRAWHAGRSQWCERANCNDYSVGIELEISHLLLRNMWPYGGLWMRYAGVIRSLRLSAIVTLRPAEKPIRGSVLTGLRCATAIRRCVYRRK